MEFPLVSFITVNYNQSEVTCDLLQSLQEISYPNIEIIVVDNGSKNDNPKIIKQKYPEIIFIESVKNLGFAGGNNLGIKKASGKYLFFINNDTVVTKEILEPLVSTLENNVDIGMISPKIRFHHTPDTIQFAGYTKLNSITLRNKLIGFRQVDKGQFDKSCDTNYAHGAAMMVPTKLIDEVGMMADIYFLYYEEIDWAFRIKKAGYRIRYIHNSLIYHKESISTGKQSPLKIYYLARNRIIFLRRNITGLKFIIGILYLYFIAFPKNVLSFLLKRKTKLVNAYFKAIFWNIKNICNSEIKKNPKL